MRVLTLEREELGGLLEGVAFGKGGESLHIDRSEAAMCDCTADGAGESKSGIEGDTAQLLGLVGCDFLDGAVKLRDTRRFGGSFCRHLGWLLGIGWKEWRLGER